MARVRLSDVAKQAGVHTATASRALNPAARDAVSAETVRRVEQAARRLGYVPNTLARGLRTSRSFVVAFVVPDITNPLFPPIVRGVEQELTGAGFTLVLTDTNNDAALERAQVSAMEARGADGFIVATARWDDAVLDELAASLTPTVLVNRRDRTGALPYVGADDRTGMQLCVDHLAGLGHRDLIHLGGPSDTSTGRERTLAFTAALRAKRMRRSGTVVECRSFTEEAGADATRGLLASRRPFTAIVAANDLLAIGAQQALVEHGLSCPDDVSVTGYNDVSFMDRLTPPLTTVRVPLGRMGTLSARTLLTWIGDPGRHEPTQTLLPVELVVRGTTAPVRQLVG